MITISPRSALDGGLKPHFHPSNPCLYPLFRPCRPTCDGPADVAAARRGAPSLGARSAAPEPLPTAVRGSPTNGRAPGGGRRAAAAAAAVDRPGKGEGPAGRAASSGSRPLVPPPFQVEPGRREAWASKCQAQGRVLENVYLFRSSSHGRCPVYAGRGELGKLIRYLCSLTSEVLATPLRGKATWRGR